MPSSRANTIPTVIHLVRQLEPRSILDIGVGFGKWGHLFREYTDILQAEHDPPRYQRANWQVRIDGIAAKHCFAASPGVRPSGGADRAEEAFHLFAQAGRLLRQVARGRQHFVRYAARFRGRLRNIGDVR